jgi:hypothetical protein
MRELRDGEHLDEVEEQLGDGRRLLGPVTRAKVSHIATVRAC